MRMAFGLVGLLVTLGVTVWIMHAVTLPQTQNALKVRDTASTQVRQWSGLDSDGRSALDSITLKPVGPAEQIQGLQVSAIDPRGVMATHYGLRVNDIITGTQGLKLSDLGGDDFNSLCAQVREAYARNATLTVQRGGEEITLPLVTASAPGAITPMSTSGN